MTRQKAGEMVAKGKNLCYTASSPYMADHFCYFVC